MHLNSTSQKHYTKYQWPASRLTSREMAILASWRESTGLPITECLRQAVELLDRIIRTGRIHSEVVR